MAAALRTALWLVLGIWVGSWLLFGLVVAPTAFRVLPSSEIAGQLVGPVLTWIHLYGAAAGVALAWLTVALGRPAWLVVLPLLLSALCLISHFGVSAQIAEIRDMTFGPEGNPEVAVRWGRLHRLSMGIFIGVGLAAVGLVALHARADAPGGGSGEDAESAGTSRKGSIIS